MMVTHGAELVNFLCRLVSGRDASRYPFMDYYLNLNAIGLSQFTHCIFGCLSLNLVSSVRQPCEFGGQV